MEEIRTLRERLKQSHYFDIKEKELLMMKIRRILCAFLLLAVIAGIFSGCNMESSQSFQCKEDFEQATIGIVTGSSHDGTAKKLFPNAERVYFNSMADMILAVEQGKIDGYLEDFPFVIPLIWEGRYLEVIEDSMGQVKNGFVFPQAEESRQLREQINSFLAQAKADGTIEQLLQKWLGTVESPEMPDYESLSGENGIIRLAISVDNKPMLYQRGDGYTGFEMELLTLFASQNGYAFDIEVVPFESIIAGISAGKYDMGASSLNITPEREESVDFSDPYTEFEVVMVIKGEGQIQTKITLSDLENATLGIVTGTNWDIVAQKQFPNAARKYFSSTADVLIALEQGKVDAIFADKTVAASMQWENQPVDYIDEPVEKISNALILAKQGYDEKLLAQLNEFIAKCQSNGTLEQLADKWFGNVEPEEHPDYTNLTGENGTLKIAVSDSMKPTAYQRGSMYTGYEVDFLTQFAAEYGYKLDLHGMTFDALIPSVASGKCDIGAAGITITPERKESVTFTDPNCETYGVAIIRGGENEPSGIWKELIEDFQKTFVREDRWKLIVKGIGVTMLISICAAAAGTLFGFGLYMLSRSDIKAVQAFANGFAKGYSRIIAGTPVVVILMILFYVIFGKIRDMSGIVVAIIGFTLTFGAFVYDHMTVSVSSVDRGQLEAAYALGYTKNKTFFRIILPQAMRIFLPSYCGQTVELIKATAVVGYITVNDLTKMGDIIRSNTYEAFFPLIATAVIYFLLTWGLSLLLQLVKLRFEPKRRSAETILKGVKTK